MQNLFSESLISPKVQASLNPGFVVRPLAASDYEKGFLETLGTYKLMEGMLTTVGKMSKTDFLGLECIT